MEGVKVEEKISNKMKKPITKNGKRLMSEAFKQGFEAGKLGIELKLLLIQYGKNLLKKPSPNQNGSLMNNLQGIVITFVLRMDMQVVFILEK